MADYATLEQVQGVLARLAERVGGNASSVPEAEIGENIARAAAEIDSKLATSYTVPFDPVPPLVNAIATDIAAYLSDLTFRETKDYSSELNPVYLRYQRAEAMLEQLQNGSAVIPPEGTDPGPGTGTGATVAVVLTRPALFSPCEFDFAPASAQQAYWTDEFWGIH